MNRFSAVNFMNRTTNNNDVNPPSYKAQLLNVLQYTQHQKQLQKTTKTWLNENYQFQQQQNFSTTDLSFIKK